MPHDTLWASIDDSNIDQHESFDTVDSNIHNAGKCSCVTEDNSSLGRWRRRQSSRQLQQRSRAATTSNIAMSNHAVQPHDLERRWSGDSSLPPEQAQAQFEELRDTLGRTLSPPRRSNYANGNLRSHSTNSSTSSATTDLTRQISNPRRTGSLAAALNGRLPDVSGVTVALNDTPASTAPNSPQIVGNLSPTPAAEGLERIVLPPVRQNSGTSTPRVRPTTLDIPGLTKSKVSPDGRIAQRDVGAKLVIVMVGLPARGKSYITKKLARYLNWLQHDTRIFNVGERRRVAAGGPSSFEKVKTQFRPHIQPNPLQQIENLQQSRRLSINTSSLPSVVNQAERISKSPIADDKPATIAQIILNGEREVEVPATPPRSATGSKPSDSFENVRKDLAEHGKASKGSTLPSLATQILSKDEPEIVRNNEEESESLEQNAAFFDPQNKKAAQIREQVARETLDELLDYILSGNGSVGILDATNSTLARRKAIMDRIRERAGPQLNVLFLESRCVDQDLLEANMRLKLNGPDYRDMDPTIALEDFKKRVREYEKAYVPLGEYEEKNNMPYIQMIDVGRKVISHQIKGFLSAQANYYLLNFNLAPRQIWITRHGLSRDNVTGKIGGDSDLAPEGILYARSLTRFMDEKRREWDMRQIENMAHTHFPPQPGDVTPPNPYYQPLSPASETNDTSSVVTDLGYEPKSFCVWTSMLKRSVETAQFFNDEDYDIKQMRMLDELNAGVMEGLTYSCISAQYPEEYRSRKADKLQYRYPGPGGEGYLDIINRLRPVIVELERMTDHVLLVGHRSVARVLLAYFRGLKREEVAEIDVPLGMLYCLEPKPYGVDFKAYRWDKDLAWFYEIPDFKLRLAPDDMQ